MEYPDYLMPAFARMTASRDRRDKPGHDKSSCQCLLGRRPPSIDLIAVERRIGGVFQPVPISEPLLWQMKQGHHVVAGQEKTVQGAHGGDEAVTVFGLEERLDHGVDAGA